MPSVGGSASASSNNSSGNQTVQLDPETRAFRDQLFDWSTNLFSPMMGQFGDNVPESFIPDQSADTQGYYQAIRDLRNPDNSVESARLNGIVTGEMQIPDFYAGADSNVADMYADLNGQLADRHAGLNGNLDNRYSGMSGAAVNDPYAIDYMRNVMSGAENVPGISGAYADSFGYDPSTYDAIDKTQIQTGASFSQPYESLVAASLIDPALANFDRQAARGLTALQAGRDAGTAFGDRARNADAIFRGDSDMNRAELEANLRRAGLESAISAGAADADRFARGALQDTALEAERMNSNADRTQNAASDFAAARNATSQFNATQGQAAQIHNNNVAADNVARRLNASTTLQDIARTGGQASFENDMDLRGAMSDLDAANYARTLGLADTRSALDAANYARMFDLAGARTGLAGDNFARGLDIAAGRTGTAGTNINNMMSAASQRAALNQQDFMNNMTRAGLLGDSGAQQDAFNLSRAQEPLDNLARVGAILSGSPYGTNTTSNSRSRGKSGTISGGV